MSPTSHLSLHPFSIIFLRLYVEKYGNYVSIWLNICIYECIQKNSHITVCRRNMKNTFGQINQTSPEITTYSFKGKHSNSSGAITAVSFKLTTENLTKFRSHILCASFICNRRSNLHYCLISQAVELLCLFKCRNASDSTKREPTPRIILCEMMWQ